MTTPRPAGDRVFADVATAVLGPGDHRSADLLDVLAQMPAGQLDVVHANVEALRGKPSQTDYNIMERLGRYALLDVRPLTGRRSA